MHSNPSGVEPISEAKYKLINIENALNHFSEQPLQMNCEVVRVVEVFKFMDVLWSQLYLVIYWLLKDSY